MLLLIRLDLLDLPADRLDLRPLLATLAADHLEVRIVFRAAKVLLQQLELVLKRVQPLFEDLHLVLHSVGSRLGRGGRQIEELSTQNIATTTLQDALVKDAQQKLQCRFRIHLIVVAFGAVCVDVPAAGVQAPIAGGLRVERVATVHVVNVGAQRIAAGVFGLRDPPLMFAPLIQHRLRRGKDVVGDRRNEAGQ